MPFPNKIHELIIAYINIIINQQLKTNKGLTLGFPLQNMVLICFAIWYNIGDF